MSSNTTDKKVRYTSTGTSATSRKVEMRSPTSVSPVQRYRKSRVTSVTSPATSQNVRRSASSRFTSKGKRVGKRINSSATTSRDAKIEDQSKSSPHARCPFAEGYHYHTPNGGIVVPEGFEVRAKSATSVSSFRTAHSSQRVTIPNKGNCGGDLGA